MAQDHSAAVIITTRISMTVLYCASRASLILFKPYCIGTDFHRAMVASAPGRITPHRAPPYEELNLIHEFAHLFSRKSINTVATRAALLDYSMHQIVCRLGLSPRAHWGAYSSPPDLLPGLKGTGGGGEGRERHRCKERSKNIFKTLKRKMTWQK